uniref:Uncharacterized protein n=1 Tax=Caenorhabditis japonica TaxID=281687 RepID=A0A8R1IV24_CAEJA
MSFSNSNSSSAIVTVDDEVSPPPLCLRAAAAGAADKGPSTKKDFICMPVWLWLILLTIIYTVLVVLLGITHDFWFFLYLVGPVLVVVVVFSPARFASILYYLFQIVFWVCIDGLLLYTLWNADFKAYGFQTVVLVIALIITSFAFTLVFLHLLFISCGSRR